MVVKSTVAYGLAVVVRVVGFCLYIGTLWGLFAYLVLDADHPANTALAYFGISDRFFLAKASFETPFHSWLAIFLFLALGLAASALFGFLAQVIQAGGYNAMKVARAQAEAEAERIAAAGKQASVTMPPFTKEEWFEALRAIQSEVVRLHDYAYNTEAEHPSVRARAEHSMALMAGMCTVIVDAVPEFEQCLTDSFKLAKAKYEKKT